MATEKKRCAWCGDDALYTKYHDEEWGVPEHDDAKLFEKLILDGFQAGLAWIMILRKRDNFRRAFDRFDAKKMARYDARKRAALMEDAGIIRSKAKIDAAIGSAQSYLRIRDSGVSFNDYIWQFTGGKTLQGKRRGMADIPTQSPESVAMSKQLKKDGFKFCGPVICYAFMQAVGMVNDHVAGCFRYKSLSR
jgi:DNA-3-methyladenine glycosylase I